MLKVASLLLHEFGIIHISIGQTFLLFTLKYTQNLAIRGMVLVRAVIRGEDGEGAILKSAPDCCLILTIWSWWWRANVLAVLKAGRVVKAFLNVAEAD